MSAAITEMQAIMTGIPGEINKTVATAMAAIKSESIDGVCVCVNMRYVRQACECVRACLCVCVCVFVCA